MSTPSEASDFGFVSPLASQLARSWPLSMQWVTGIERKVASCATSTVF